MFCVCLSVCYSSKQDIKLKLKRESRGDNECVLRAAGLKLSRNLLSKNANDFQARTFRGVFHAGKIGHPTRGVVTLHVPSLRIEAHQTLPDEFLIVDYRLDSTDGLMLPPER